MLVVACQAQRSLAQRPSPPEAWPFAGYVVTKADGVFAISGKLSLEKADVTAGEIILIGRLEGVFTRPDGSLLSSFEQAEATLLVAGSVHAGGCEALLLEVGSLFELLGLASLTNQVVLSLPLPTEGGESAKLRSLLCDLAHVFDEGSPWTLDELVPAINHLLK